MVERSLIVGQCQSLEQADGIGILHIELAYIDPERQILRELLIPSGATVADAIKASRIEDDIGIIVPDRIGIFSRRVALTHRLRDGDRIEIYRPLQIDPKESRRRRAERR